MDLVLNVVVLESFMANVARISGGSAAANIDRYIKSILCALKSIIS